MVTTMPVRHSAHGGPAAARTALRLRDLIDGGSYAPGDVVPSVRSLATTWGISPATVVQAYRRLVDEQVLTNLPRIGHRVLARPADGRLTASIRPPGGPTVASVGDAQIAFLRDCDRLPGGYLGTAHPDPALLPLAELQRRLRRCLRADPACGLTYRIGPGDPGLRRQIARRYGMRGRRADPDEVILTNGCSEALVLALRTLCAPGDVVAVESPTFFNHLRILEHLRLRVIEIPIDARSGLDPDQLERTFRRHQVRALLTVPVLHNPLGVSLSAERQRAILAACARHEVGVVEDVIYVGLSAADQRPPILRDHPTTIPVLTCGSVSKVLAPGWRIGWVLAGALADRIVQAKVVSSLGSPTLQQEALASFLADHREDAVLSRAAATYRERLRLGRSLVLRHFPAGTRCSDPEGGMVLWIELPDGIAVDALYRQATAVGLCFAPGYMFGIHEQHPRHLRICVSRLHPEAQAAIARIGQMAGALRRRTLGHGD
jgi:DNA-binding transcriptional MocR family regulator